MEKMTKMSTKFTIVNVNNECDLTDPVIDWSKCIVCQETSADILQCPYACKRSDIPVGSGYTTFACNILQFMALNESLPKSLKDVIKLNNNTNLETFLHDKQAKWHKKCSIQFNRTQLLRAEKRKSNENEDNTEGKSTRLSTGASSSVSSSRCFFCNEEANDLTRVSTLIVDEKVRNCAKILQDNMLIAKLSAGDMVAQDAMYHGNCLTNLHRRALRVQNKCDENIVCDKQIQGIVFAELIGYMEDVMEQSHIAPVFKVVDLRQKYIERLQQFGVTDIDENTTRLKERILSAHPNIKEFKQGRGTILIRKKDVGCAIKKACNYDFDDEAMTLLKAAKIIRRDLIQQDKTKFQGKFAINCQQESVPESLKSLLGMILYGPNIQAQCNNTIDVQAKLTIAQLMRHNYVLRQRSKTSTALHHSKDREPPLAVYLGFMIHATTRRRDLIEKLYNLGLSISYNRVLTLSTEMGTNICKQFDAENIVCPTKLRSGLFTTGAVDNIDHDPSSTTAQGSFHGTGISLFQHPSHTCSGTERHVTAVDTDDSKPTAKLSLPKAYLDISPVSLYSSEPVVPGERGCTIEQSDTLSVATEKDKRWLRHVEEEVTSKEDENTAESPPDMTVSWASFNATYTEYDVDRPVNISALLPLFEDKAQSVPMIHHAMKLIKQSVEFLNPGQKPVMACDQPLYAIAKLIQWNMPSTLGEDDIVIMFGGLHIEMCALKAIGKWLDGSGWCNAISDANVASAGKAESYIHASHVNRAFHAHQITVCALYILMQNAYKEYRSNTCTTQHLDFEPWCEYSAQNYPQFRYWYITYMFILDILCFMRSLREGNFKLYKEALSKLIPWFFALDHVNYARWVPIHLRDMLALEEKHPNIHKEFVDGNFVVCKTHRAFSALPIDQAHEQNNKLVKGDGGAVGLTENSSQLTRWMVCGPEVARLVNEFEKSQEIMKHKQQNICPDRRHHEQIESVQIQFVKEVSDLKNSVTKMGNPFCEKSNDVLVLDTRDIVDTSVTVTINTIQDLGKTQYNTFVEERLVKHSQSLFVPIKRNNLPLFRTPKVRKSSKTKQNITSLKQNCTLFSELYISCQRREGDIAEFFCHENLSYPPSLSLYGDLRSGTKPDIVKCLNPHIPPQNDRPDVDAIILDGAAIVNILAPRNSLTFSEYSQNVFMPYIQSQPANRIDIVWDVYLADSLKATTRTKRGGGTRRRVGPDVHIPGNWQNFLRVEENKTELFSILAEECALISNEQKLVISTHGKDVLANQPIDVTSLAPCSQEEADSRIFLHAKDCSNRGCERVLIRTVDSDVVILSVAHYTHLNLKQLWLAYGTGQNHRYIAAHSICQSLGQDVAESLLMFHAFTGCDQTSFFFGRGKTTAWDTASTKYLEILTVFSSLFACGERITDETIKENMPVIEKFVVLMYDKKSSCTTVNEARLDLFTKQGRAMDMLPPTYEALFQHSKRAAFQAILIWGQALQRCPPYLSPIEWGWTKSDSGSWTPMWSTLPGASAACLEFRRCWCKIENGCKHCKCVKSLLPCTALCKCGGECERE